MLGEAFKFRKPDAVRIAINEDKREGRQQKQKHKFFSRAWRFVRRKNRIDNKAKRKGLDDELNSELQQ